MLRQGESRNWRRSAPKLHIWPEFGDDQRVSHGSWSRVLAAASVVLTIAFVLVHECSRHEAVIGPNEAGIRLLVGIDDDVKSLLSIMSRHEAYFVSLEFYAHRHLLFIVQTEGAGAPNALRRDLAEWLSTRWGGAQTESWPPKIKERKLLTETKFTAYAPLPENLPREGRRAQAIARGLDSGVLRSVLAAWGKDAVVLREEGIQLEPTESGVPQKLESALMLVPNMGDDDYEGLWGSLAQHPGVVLYGVYVGVEGTAITLACRSAGVLPKNANDGK